MPVTPDSPAPYAPAAAILEIIKRHRSRGLPSPVNAEVLGRSGISESLIPRTLYTLKVLDLVDEQDNPTEAMETLRLAPEAEFPNRLREWLNNSYADVLKFVDPETADETALRDAFRSYKPIGQQSRMVTLFAGLYGAAGVGRDKAAPPRAMRRGRAPENGGGVKRQPIRTEDPAGKLPPPPPPRSPPTSITDKALEYKLVDLLKNADIKDEERSAVWTLIQYLATRGRSVTQSPDQ